ncbi:MAG TPA: PhzF family phenazine biosynthesis protein [Thermoanaerobaculia bacterium]|nr:PhzF family phenazine biosynthesis protein [Thermoanaerobaculia bacterium]
MHPQPRPLRSDSSPAEPLRIVQVDAFTDRAFRGNPAAVGVLPAPRPDAWLQAFAREMNLSETAFLLRRARPGAHRRDDRGVDWDLRWFTPLVEVDLCGHATLASAHVLWQEGHLAADAEARFHTASGLLSARRAGDWIELDFPALPPRPVAPPAGLAGLLGTAPRWVGANDKDLLVELASEAEVRALAPDRAAVARLPIRGLIVTAAAQGPGGGYDFVSRFFCPAVGIDEDPVTGSAHCALGPFWAERLGRPEVIGHQASERGGTVRVRPAGDRVVLAGQAVTVLTAELSDAASAAMTDGACAGAPP